MSTFWEEYRKRVTEGALKLSTPPKDIPQNILWLKAYVTERIENDKIEGRKHAGKPEGGTPGPTETRKPPNAPPPRGRTKAQGDRPREQDHQHFLR